MSLGQDGVVWMEVYAHIPEEDIMGPIFTFDYRTPKAIVDKIEAQAMELLGAELMYVSNSFAMAAMNRAKIHKALINPISAYKNQPYVPLRALLTYSALVVGEEVFQTHTNMLQQIALAYDVVVYNAWVSRSNMEPTLLTRRDMRFIATKGGGSPESNMILATLCLIVKIPQGGVVIGVDKRTEK